MATCSRLIPVAVALILVLCTSSSVDAQAGEGLMRLIRANPQLGSFVNALGISRIDKTLIALADGEEVTVFAPNNDAFSRLQPVLKDCLATPSGAIDILTQILLFHIAVGKNYTAQELRTLPILTSAKGIQLNLELDLGAPGAPGTIMIEKQAAIVVPDVISTLNSTVHIIDDVLIPLTIEGTINVECYHIYPSLSAPAPSPVFGAV